MFVKTEGELYDIHGCSFSKVELSCNKNKYYITAVTLGLI